MTNFQNRPTAGELNSVSSSSFIDYSSRRRINISKFSNADFNRLPARPEFDEYDNVDDGDDDNDADNNQGYQRPTVASQNIQNYPGSYPGGGYLGTFHKLKRKKKGVICVPHYGGYSPFGGIGSLFGGIGSHPLKGWGLGSFHGLGFGSLFRSEDADIDNAESRQYQPHDDPRTIFKLQSNYYNYGGGGYSPLYKPSSGYPCRPVDFYGQRPGFGQFGYFSDQGNGGGGGGGGYRPGLQSDTPSRPTGVALGILSDTFKPVLESNAIQDGVGSAVILLFYLLFIQQLIFFHKQISSWSPGIGVSNILNAVGGITGQFATAPVAAVKQIQQINRDFASLIF